VNFKVIACIFFLITFSIKPILAKGMAYNASTLQLKKTVGTPLADSTQAKASGGIGIKKNADKFFTAFGKIFESKKKSGKVKKSNPGAETSSVKRTREVFGFYPYELEDSFDTYDFKLLSSLAYFGYQLDPYTGKSTYSKQWKTTKLIDAAKANNTKVYLTVTSPSEKSNRIFLDTIKPAKAAQERSINTILQMLNDREAYGVVIYFEDIPCEYKINYRLYIEDLSRRLREFNKKVVVVLPALDTNDCFDVMGLAAYVEYFVVMADDYYGNWSDVAGPVAPLHGGNLWTQGNLENTIEDYLSEGIPKEQLIISLPFYANKWETEDENVPSYAKKFLEKLTFKNVQENYPQKVYFDPESQTKYLNYKVGNKFIQVWFDDARSIRKKYDFINTEQLAGVGIRAISIDDGKTALWEALNSKFKQDKGYIPPKPVTWLSIFKKDGVVKGILWVAALIFIFGFLLSLRNTEIRNIFFTGSLIKNMILFGIPLLLSIVMYLLLENKMWAIMVFVGILSGYGLYYLLQGTEQNSNNANRIP
jgi:spore germination protein YaaH